MKENSGNTKINNIRSIGFDSIGQTWESKVIKNCVVTKFFMGQFLMCWGRAFLQGDETFRTHQNTTKGQLDFPEV